MTSSALICFLKFPAPGHVKTRLAAEIGDEHAVDLYASLAERLITEVYPMEGGYDLVLCYDPQHDQEQFETWLGSNWTFWEQERGDLGTRLSCAVDRALDEGYQKIALIGSDCIGFSEESIDAMFGELDHHDFVVGPASDGGYYLIALKEYNPWLFEDIHWSTETVLETTLDKIEVREKTVHQLEEKQDIDTIDDLSAFRRKLPEEHFLAKKIDLIALRTTDSTEMTEQQRQAIQSMEQSLNDGLYNSLPIDELIVKDKEIDSELF
ncbi:TIGR04282 family arsenosugar biosynthesis glycosyltransferase [Acanthopleuribacter pedis]|uniref:TIGR04282 family arsenosugar biosynthesis glycosyltransferase n=1 Tax=Acanthopleuribacter pedis TaxID=442870 RepID=A0A8J7U711_9BACT|nr:TIGR04282 family arsenosugar biosynthesis glycosyltransferase [Acanthopleuribacter pedis]MBO1322003.1 TIGR04282 family arsenosugar biosynthesis glycosyltransferase [Acanthopleuribacter pedis]